MTAGSTIYQNLCAAGDIDHALRRITDAELTALAEYLGVMPVRGGIPAMVWGAVQGELGRRGPRKKKKGVAHV